MEVHAHTHSPRKKWTHYFWEFLMLFLAVTLGFIVENRREHFIEHKREKEYAISMVNDLKEDTLELKTLVTRYQFAANSLDTFLNLISQSDLRSLPGGKLYWYGIWGCFLHPFTSNDASFQQMKNSGSLRYIRNRELGHKIAQYDQWIRRMDNITSRDLPIYTEARKISAQIFDFRYNRTASDIATSVYIALSEGNPIDQARIDSLTSAQLGLLTYDKALLNQYAEICRTRTIRIMVRNLEVAFLQAEELIRDLKKEYHLD